MRRRLRRRNSSAILHHTHQQNDAFEKQQQIHIQVLRDFVDAAAADPHSEHRDGLMLEVEEQCDGFSTMNEDIENLVERQERLMSYGTFQHPLLVRALPWPARPSWSP